MTTLMISFTPEFLVIFQLLWDTPVPLTVQCCGFWGGACQRYRGQSKVYQTCQSTYVNSLCSFGCLFGCPYVCLCFVWCPYVCLFLLSDVHMSVCLLSLIYFCKLCNFYVVRYLFIKLNGFQKKKSKQLIFVLLLNKCVVGIFKQFSECINYTSF